MKKLLASIVLIASSGVYSYAQQEELKSAGENIEKQDYISALDDISKAKKKVNDLMTAQLASVLPAKYGEFEMADSEDYGMGDAQGISMNKAYRKPAPKKENEGSEGEEMMDMSMDMGSQSEITVQITNNMMMASEVMSAHAMSEEGMSMEGMKTEAFRVKGYRALSKSFGGESNEGEEGGMGMGEQKVEEAHAIVGGAFIIITARGLEKEGQAKAFLELIDFEKLIGIVGK